MGKQFNNLRSDINTEINQVTNNSNKQLSKPISLRSDLNAEEISKVGQ